MDALSSAADAVAATTKKLEKKSILAAYLSGLVGDALPVACVFLTGQPFPLRSERTVKVGGALLRDAAMAVTGVSAEEFEAAYLRHGDSGGAIAELLEDGDPPDASLTVLAVLGLYEKLSATSKTAERRDLLAEGFRSCRSAAAKYVVKIATGTMRIGVQESLVEEALAEAFGRDADDVRWANMLIGDIGQAATLARDDRLGEARLELFRPVKSMLATAADEAADALKHADEWLVEDKYDGMRAQVHAGETGTRIYSRTLDEVTSQFPEVAAVFDGSRELVIDGEIIAQAGDEQLGFAELSKRQGRKDPDQAILEEIPTVFVAFDLLAIDGHAELRRPLTERRSLLADAMAGIDGAKLSEMTMAGDADTIQAAFDAAIGRGNEGLMLKNPDSQYQPGKRGRAWLKLKRPLATLDVVIVGAEYGHGRRAGLLSDYTFAVRAGDKLAPVGKAYSGVTNKEIAFLTDHFKQNALKDFGRGVLVPPTIVIEVAFNGIQKSKRHGSGFALRFPRIKGLRLDKSTNEIDTLERVEELWAKQTTAK